MRKLASVRLIDAITPINGADAIECVTIGGWKCVAKKGEFEKGQLCVYVNRQPILWYCILILWKQLPRGF